LCPPARGRVKPLADPAACALQSTLPEEFLNAAAKAPAPARDHVTRAHEAALGGSGAHELWLELLLAGVGQAERRAIVLAGPRRATFVSPLGARASQVEIWPTQVKPFE